MKINWKLVIKLTVIGAIVFTYLSTFFCQKEMAFTMMGDYIKEEAVRMGLETQIYKGWPSLMPWQRFEIEKLDNPTFFILYLWAYLFLIIIFSLPNLLFWGLASFVLMIIYYSALRLLKR